MQGVGDTRLALDCWLVASSIRSAVEMNENEMRRGIPGIPVNPDKITSDAERCKTRDEFGQGEYEFGRCAYNNRFTSALSGWLVTW
jgi:hypothetical protein